MTNKPYTFAIRTIQPHKAKIAKENGFLTLNQTTEKRGMPITTVWQNGGFSAKFNGSSSIELLCKTEHLCFDFRHFAKLQNVVTLIEKILHTKEHNKDTTALEREIDLMVYELYGLTEEEIEIIENG